ncbi:MAG: type IVB secretion system protein IcmH/DotU [Amphritea sp.]
MTMDYLDEATIEVAQPGRDTGTTEQLRRLPLEGAAQLKNQAQNLSDLKSFSHHDNKLINAGSELLSLCVSISRLPCPEDIHRFRQGLNSSITELKQRIESLDYPKSVADKTCFLFCIVLDEFILHSDWGEDVGWENQTLVSELFGMRNGGEQFYIVAEKALAQPNLLLDLLELIYIFIKIGFLGQYRLMGRERLDGLIQQIETVLFHTRPPVPFHAQTKAQMPKLQRPRKQARFGRQLLLFVGGIVLVWGASSYWYLNSFEQRARDFLSLSEFSKTYLNVEEDVEVVYVSTAEEMKMAARAYGEPDVPTAVAPSEPAVASSDSSAGEPQGRWQVQLATFDDPDNCNEFISRHDLTSLDARVEPHSNQFRVVITAANRQQANSLLKQVRSKGILDAFIFSNQQGG